MPTQNPLRHIKNWPAFTKILEQRFDSARDYFSLMTGAEQGEFIKHQFQVAGASANPGAQNSTKKKLKTSQKMKKLLKQSKTIKKKLKSRVLQPPQISQRLRSESKQILETIRILEYNENLSSKQRIKAVLAKKGVKAQRLFWNLVNHKPKKKNFFEALITGAGLSTNQDQMNATIESFFERKFNTSFNLADIRREEVDLSKIGSPEEIFSQEASDNDGTYFVGRIELEHKGVRCK